MFLERLELSDFRNYESLRLEPDRPLGIFAGENAQGKTNILEAVLLLAISRSPRTSHDGEMVRWGADEAIVRGEVRRTTRDPVAVTVRLRRDGAKAVRVNGLAKRPGEAVGEVNAVMFGPEDLRLVSGGPAERRAFLNACLGQTSRRFLAALSGYRGALRQRNKLLKDARDGRLDEDLLLTYDDQLAAEAGRIMAGRVALVRHLDAETGAVHGRLSRGREQLRLAYEPDVPLPEETTEEALAEAVRERLIGRRSAELRRGVTLVGPHRDDLRIGIDGTDARSFASQGQQRTAALALKIAELRVVARAVGEPPLLLLDDVLSELDDGRRREVMSLTDEAEQVLITCSQERVFDEAVLDRAGLYRVVGGSLETVAAGEPQ